MDNRKELLDDYLAFLCYKGWKKRIEPFYKDTPQYQEYKNRLAIELEVIQGKNLSSYHLIVADYVNWAIKQGILVGPARGSAAGSLVCYLIGITRVDPLIYDLLFERYINPEREALSDIDLDFEDRRRDEVKDYLKQKYGDDRVAGIATLSRLGAKSVIKDVARSLQIAGKDTFTLANQITNTIPGIETALEEAQDMSEAFVKYMTQFPQLWNYAKGLEGIIRQPGMHAAGAIISDKPLAEHMPLQVQKEVITTQYDKDILEEAGFLKVDLLGLKNLTIIQDTKRNIKKLYGKELKKIPLGNEKTYQLLRAGQTSGVFQLESQGMRVLLRDIAVSDINDLAAVLALFRPGPLDAGMAAQYAARKHGREPIMYDHQLLEGALKTTFGLIVYEEQIQRIACDLCGFTLGKADTMRRACKKKDPKIMRSLEDEFVAGAAKNYVPAQLSKEIFEKIVFFSGYSFNRCLSGDTEIQNSRTGKKYKLENLANKPLPEEITLYSKDENENLIENELVEVFSTGEKEVFEVEFDNGETIKATMDHKFYCEDKEYHTLREIYEKGLEIKDFTEDAEYFEEMKMWHQASEESLANVEREV
jgi:DNA polymerase-3 subunit alpha